MTQLSHIRTPEPLSRYLAMAELKRLSVGERLDFDNDTYVLRKEDRYIAYRTWMSILPIIEVFQLDSEADLIRWLEQFGYSFS